MSSEADKKPPKRRNTDWEAAHREYRTGKFTPQELADKYGVSRQAVDKQIKKNGWEKDLTDAIRQETNAALTKKLVADQVAESCEKVADVVKVAAEANAQILLKQQRRAAELQDVIDLAKCKVLEHADKLKDIRDVATLTGAVNNLANATKTLNEQERRAHNMDAEDSEGGETGIEELWRRVRSEG